jgi:hypothetical protein
MKWEVLRVTVRHNEQDKVDFVAKRDSTLDSIATHDTIEVHFNVTHKEWDAFQQRLKEEDWELEKVERRSEAEESYHFRRAKE